MADSAGPNDAGGKAPDARQGLPNKRDEEFKIVRSAPVEESSNPLPIILVVLALAIGGFFWFTQKKDGDADATPTTNGGTAPIVVEPPVDPNEPVEIDSVIENRLTFLEGEGRIEDALAFAEEQLKVFPSQKLRARIKEYRRKLGVTGAKSTTELLTEAQKALAEQRFADALALAEQVIEKDDKNAVGFYVRGVSKGETGDALGAVNDLENAVAYGHPQAAQIEELIKRYQQ